MSKTSLLLRSAAVITVLQYVAHGALFSVSVLRQPNSIAERLSAISAGSDKSVWNLYVGYGIIAVVFGLLQTFSLLICASLPAGRPLRIAALALSIVVLTHAAVVWYFFGLWVPIIFDLLVLCLTAGAAVTAFDRRH